MAEYGRFLREWQNMVKLCRYSRIWQKLVKVCRCGRKQQKTVGSKRIKKKAVVLKSPWAIKLQMTMQTIMYMFTLPTPWAAGPCPI